MKSPWQWYLIIRKDSAFENPCFVSKSAYEWLDIIKEFGTWFLHDWRLLLTLLCSGVSFHMNISKVSESYTLFIQNTKNRQRPEIWAKRFWEIVGMNRDLDQVKRGPSRQSDILFIEIYIEYIGIFAFLSYLHLCFITGEIIVARI